MSGNYGAARTTIEMIKWELDAQKKNKLNEKQSLDRIRTMVESYLKRHKK